MVLCRDDTCRETCMQTHILILWPHNWSHIWSHRRAGKRPSGDDLCSMFQGRTKFTNSGLTLATFSQVTSDISLLWRGYENVSKKGNNSQQLIRPSHFSKVSLEEWWKGKGQALVLVSHWLFFYMWRTSFNNSPKSVKHSVAFQESVCLLTLFYFLPYNKQNKRLSSLCPWISQICRKWQMFRCHS